MTRRLASLIETLAEMWAVDAENFGSTTFQREDLACGFEPDCCFYIENIDAISESDEIDLGRGDPPPDLVIEIAPSGTALAKAPIYERVGVPEVWQVDGSGNIRILLRTGGTLAESPVSAVFPKVASEDLNELLLYSEKATQVEFLKRVRQWAFIL